MLLIHRSRLVASALVLLLSTTALGCFYSREMADIQRDIQQAYPEAEFDREVVVTLGPRVFRSVGWLAGFAPNPYGEMAASYMDEIRRIKVGVYKVRRLDDLEDVDIPSLERFRKDDWEVAVKVHENNEVVWVLYREHREEVRDLYVVVLSEDELVMARLDGHLNRLLEKAVQDHRYLTDMEYFDWEW